jgi:ABC-type multidrug transport system fused ATPase/permease subunit
LLLDEITSQLDSRNELALREAIARVSERCTVMVVAHRLSTVVDAERIVVLDGGRVSSVGTHEELLASEPLYRELAENQLVDAHGSTGERQSSRNV